MVGILSSWAQRRSLLTRPLAYPEPGSAATSDPQQADMFILANGLERLLGQCAPGTAERHFPTVLKAQRALRVQRRLQLALHLPAQMLSDLCHEIAQVVAAPVRHAAVRALRRHAALRAAAALA